MITEIKIELTNHYAMMWRFDEPVGFNSKEMLKGFKKLLQHVLEYLSFSCDYKDGFVFIDSLWCFYAEDEKWWRM